MRTLSLAQAPALPARSRIAGALYLLIIVCGITSEAVLRSSLIVPGADLESAQRILAALPAWRISLLGDTIMVVADVAIALVFLSIFSATNHGLAMAATVFRLMQAAMIGFGIVVLAAVPDVLSAGYHEIGMSLVRMHATGYDFGLIFFGINTLLMTALLRQAWAPAPLTWLLAGAGIVYIAGGLLRLTLPGLSTAFMPAYLLPLVAETAFCLWLLFRARL